MESGSYPPSRRTKIWALTRPLDVKSPVCDSYVRPAELVRICDECNFGTYGGRCIICGSPGVSLLLASEGAACGE